MIPDTQVKRITVNKQNMNTINMREVKFHCVCSCHVSSSVLPFEIKCSSLAFRKPSLCEFTSSRGMLRGCRVSVHLEQWSDMLQWADRVVVYVRLFNYSSVFSKSVDTKPGSNWCMSLLLILFPGKEMKKLTVTDSKYQQTNKTTKGNKPATASKRKRPLNPQSQGGLWSQCSYYAEIINLIYIINLHIINNLHV